MSTHSTPKKEGKGDERDWWPAFFLAFAGSGNVLASARTAGVTRFAVYKARKRSAEFRERWDAAQADAADILEAEAWRRAVKGVDTPIYHGGKKIDTVKEYSDTLLIFLLKGCRPEKFRDNYDITKLADELRRRDAMAQPAAGTKAGGRRK